MHMEKKYNNGEVVFDRVRPNQKLVIRNYSKNLYYCIPLENKTKKQLVYSERELSISAAN